MPNKQEDTRLERYYKIGNGGALPRFQMSKRIPLPAGWQDLSTPEKWKLNDSLSAGVCDPANEMDISSRKIADENLLTLKTNIATEIVKSCHLCERRCGVDRSEGELGYCKVPLESYYASEFIHVGEEPEIIPSHTIFFAGCTFQCIHCQNSEIINNPTSEFPVDDDLRKRIENRFLRGARNVNLVGGNPDQHLHNILKLFLDVDVPPPVIWNSNMYHSSESEKLLKGFVDLYLADFKYGPSDCGERLSDADTYWDIITRNFLSARDHAEIYIRHLLLPEHVECCTKEIIKWTSENLPKAKFNLMFQYHPSYKAFGHKEIGRILSAPEKQRALELMAKHEINA